MSTRSYTAATEAAIFAMSLKCYYPECAVPSVNILKKGEAKKNVHIAHIVAVKPGGARYRRMPDGEVNSFRNLILLCTAHHPMVDTKENEHKYTEAILHRWKQENEAELKEKVDGLDRLTESDLDGIFRSAIAEAKDEILGAIDELKGISEGAAELLKSLYSKIEDHYINEEAVELLHAASGRLEHLPDSAGLIYSASRSFENIGDDAKALKEASDTLSRLNITHQTEALSDVVEELSRVINRRPDIPNVAESIEEAGISAIKKIENKTRSIDLPERPVVVDDKQRWSFALRGFAAGMVTCVIFAVAMAIWYAGSLGEFVQR